MRVVLVTLHKYVSLTLAALWLLQALTGSLSVFFRELDDWSSGFADTQVDIDALSAGLQRLQASRPDDTVSSLYSGGGFNGQFDVFVGTKEGAHVVRMDGAGNVLRERPWAHDFGAAGVLHLCRIFHESLLAGDRGWWFIGLSGVFLLSNLVLGLKLAWPRKGQWRRSLLPPKAQSAVGLFYSWHRAAGLWFAWPAMILVSAGILIAWGSTLESWLGEWAAAPEIPHVQAQGGSAIAPAAALRIAMQRYPDAAPTMLRLPSEDFPAYTVRVRQKWELRRVFGMTTIYVDARNGQVLADYDATKASPRHRFLNLLYPIHTGEAGGLLGRIVVLAVGLWLLSMIGLGLGMWWTRRANRRA